MALLANSFARAKHPKRLEWRPQLGSCAISVAAQGAEARSVRASLIQASVLLCFHGLNGRCSRIGDAAEHQGLSAPQISAQCNSMPVAWVEKALRFWVAKVWRRSLSSPQSALVETTSGCYAPPSAGAEVAAVAEAEGEEVEDDPNDAVRFVPAIRRGR
jgi:hypothetical protein